jgi:hypothetical protein
MNNLTIAIAYNHKRFFLNARWPKAKTLWQSAKQRLQDVSMTMAMVLFPVPATV